MYCAEQEIKVKRSRREKHLSEETIYEIVVGNLRGRNATRQMCILFTDNQANNSVRTPRNIIPRRFSDHLAFFRSFFYSSNWPK